MARTRNAYATVDGAGISTESGGLDEAWLSARAGAGRSACRGRACVDRGGIYARATRAGWNCRCRRQERGRFMNVLSGFADITSWQLVPVAAVALFASIIGGVSGYGTGALMPLVLVPLVGAEPVVPIIAISALFTNSSRVFAFQ